MPDLNLTYAPKPPWLAPNTDNSAFEGLLAATANAQRNRQLLMREHENATHAKSVENSIANSVLQHQHAQLDIDAQRVAASDAAAYKAASIGAAQEMSLQNWVNEPDVAMDNMYRWVDSNVNNPYVADKILKSAEARHKIGMDIALRRSMEQLRKTQGEENEAQTEKIRTEAWLGKGNQEYSPSEAGKKAEEFERAVGRKLAEEERQVLYGLKPRAAVTRELLEDEYVQKKLDAWIGSREGIGKTRQQGIDALRKEFRTNFDEKALSAPPSPGPNERFMRGEVESAPSPKSLSSEFFKSPFYRPKK